MIIANYKRMSIPVVSFGEAQSAFGKHRQNLLTGSNKKGSRDNAEAFLFEVK
jgi:hypothetical protein